MKVVIISRTIHPSQYPRSHRATELAKELARQGHDVTIYAVLGKYDYRQFQKEHNLKVRSIGRMLFARLSSDGVEWKNKVDRAVIRLCHKWLEYPDIELMFKMPGIMRKEREADLVISIAIPHSIHWGCALAKSLDKKNFPRVWAADCGDPYMGNPFSKKAFYFKYMEKWFCRLADFITVPFEGARAGYYPEFANKIKVIPQGFRFDEAPSAPCHKKIKPTFAFAGNFYRGFRDPSKFLEYLSGLKTDFTFVVYTKENSLLLPFLEKLSGKLEIRDYVPHRQLIQELGRMDFLVNFENGSQVQQPSKLIDYAMAQRPVLSIAPGELPINTINEFLKGDYKNSKVIENIEQFDIANVAREFISLTEQTVSQQYAG